MKRIFPSTFWLKKTVATLLATVFVLQPFMALAAEEVGPQMSVPVPESVSSESFSDVPAEDLEITDSPLEIMGPGLDAESKSDLGDVDPSDLSEHEVGDLDPSAEKLSKPDLGDGGVTPMAVGDGSDQYYPGFKSDTSIGNKTSESRVDESSGAFLFDFPIPTPRGRNGIEPDLKLHYSSQDRSINENIVGLGWSVPIPYIERFATSGTQDLYSKFSYRSSVSGELVRVASDRYAARSERGDFLDYQLADNAWVVKDKKGITYTFGNVSTTQVLDSASSTKIFRWMMTEMRDLDGNYATYSYVKDQGQVYPDQITYTHATGTEGIFTIIFDREARPITNFTYRPGFLVKTAYRISVVRVLVSGNERYRLTLGYDTGDNTTNSRIKSLVERYTGPDGTQQTKPSMVFGYEKNVRQWVGPSTLPGGGGGEQIGEVNGDGLPDAIVSRINYNQTTGLETPFRRVYIGTGFGVSSTWNIPAGLEFIHLGSFSDLGARFTDMDGDGLSDFIAGNKIWRNGLSHPTSPTSSWYDTGINVPVGFTSFYGGTASYEPNGTYLVDLNHDGFTDILRKNDAYLFNGTGFVTSTAWTLPMPLSTFSKERVFRQTQFTDLNGDGLLDLVHVSGTRALHNDKSAVFGLGYATPTHSFFLNTGSGWTEDASSSTFQQFAANGQFYKGFNPAANQLYVYVNSSRFADVNGDGLQDFIFQREDKTIDVSCGRQVAASVPGWKYLLNTGSGFVTSSNFGDYFHEFTEVSQPAGCTLKYGYYRDLGTNVLDLTGDSVVDRANFQPRYNGTKFADNSDIGTSDTLTVIGYPEGATTTIGYAGSGQQFNVIDNPASGTLNRLLPINIRVVDSIDTDDRNGTVTSTRYTYDEGVFTYNRNRPQDSAFAGFGKVRVTSPGGIRTVYFHQGNTTTAANGEYADSYARLGLPYKTVMSDKFGNVYSTELMKYDETPLSSESGEASRAFVGLARKVIQSYDGGAAHRDVAEVYSYDPVGNVIDVLQYGEVTSTTPTSFTDIAGDSRRTVYEYALLPGGVSSTLVSKKIENGFGTSSRVTTYTYDDQFFGSALYGHQTQALIADASSTLRISTSSTYSSLGLPLSVIDARGNTTTLEYDSAHLYVGTTTNPLGYYVTSTFDYFFGEPTRIRDENGQIKRMVYDPSGRQKEFYGPDAAGNEVKLWDIAYTDSRNAFSTLKNTYYSATSTDIVYSYFDGYGRLSQTKRTSYGVYWYGEWKRYDGEGRVFLTTIPIFSQVSASSSPISTTEIRMYQYYDALSRKSRLTTILGSEQSTYSMWTETTTDPLGKIKKIKRDAYGRIIEVVERNAGIDYPTKYGYDHFGNLLSITDPKGAVRNFRYDALGRRISAEDVHSSGDTGFLGILYSYDENGNLLAEHRNDATSLGYSYDALNRRISISQNSSTVNLLAYDSCPSGVGKLCQESSNAYFKEYVYDSAGALKSTDFIYGSSTYSELFERDRQGRVTSSTLPDGSSLQYIYNGWQMLRLNARESSATTTTPIIRSIYYGESMLPELIRFGNDVVMSYARDRNRLHRLTSASSAFNVGPEFQNLQYSYDAMNRITMVRELSATTTKRNVTYTYDDLDRLVGASATTTGNVVLYKEAYGYDPVGNILWTNLIDPTGTSTTSTYSYGSPLNANTHAVTAVSSTRNNIYQGYTSLAYDLRGNVATTTWYNASGTEDMGLRRENIYDAANQMLATGLGSATQTLLYLYDKDGMRITQKFATTTIVYSSPIYNATIDASGARIDTEKHLGDGSRTFATIDGTGLGARYLYNHPDHLTGANAITTGARTFEEVLDYMPFGAVRVDSKAGSWSEQRQYIGKDFDSTSGYNYFDARYYDSSVKRFNSQDPAVRDKPEDFLSDPQQLNFYAYARNSPIVYKDPSGRCVDGISTAACVGAGVLLTAIIGGAVAELYGAVTGDVRVIQAGQSARMIGESGGAALIQAKGGMNPITGEKGMEFKVVDGANINKPSSQTNASKTQNKVHGNSLNYTGKNYGYTLEKKGTGDIMKFGETINPDKRYTRSWLETNSLQLKVQTEGTKKEVHTWQNQQIIQYTDKKGARPPLNKSNW